MEHFTQYPVRSIPEKKNEIENKELSKTSLLPRRCENINVRASPNLHMIMKHEINMQRSLPTKRNKTNAVLVSTYLCRN